MAVSAGSVTDTTVSAFAVDTVVETGDVVNDEEELSPYNPTRRFTTRRNFMIKVASGAGVCVGAGVEDASPELVAADAEAVETSAVLTPGNVCVAEMDPSGEDTDTDGK